MLRKFNQNFLTTVKKQLMKVMVKNNDFADVLSRVVF